jgi:hypothetical protein
MNIGDRCAIACPKGKRAWWANQEVTILHTNEVGKPAASSRQILPAGRGNYIIGEDHNEAIITLAYELGSDGANHGSIGIVRQPIASTLPVGVVPTTYVETYHLGTSIASPLHLINKMEFIIDKTVTQVIKTCQLGPIFLSEIMTAVDPTTNTNQRDQRPAWG